MINNATSAELTTKTQDNQQLQQQASQGRKIVQEDQQKKQQYKTMKKKLVGSLDQIKVQTLYEKVMGNSAQQKPLQSYQRSKQSLPNIAQIKKGTKSGALTDREITSKSQYNKNQQLQQLSSMTSRYEENPQQYQFQYASHMDKLRQIKSKTPQNEIQETLNDDEGNDSSNANQQSYRDQSQDNVDQQYTGDPKNNNQLTGDSIKRNKNGVSQYNSGFQQYQLNSQLMQSGFGQATPPLSVSSALLQGSQMINQQQALKNSSQILLNNSHNQLSQFQQQQQQYLIPRNNFTERDSRFDQILKLNKQNEFLNNEIVDLQEELQEIDQFKIAMDREKKIEDFQEKRIEMLKAQVVRQKMYIQKLTGLLQMTRKNYKQIWDVFNFFSKACFKVNQLNGKDVYESLPKSDKAMTSEMDKMNAIQSLRNLLNTFTNVEERDHFVQNFNNTYAKINELDRQNAEVKQMFKFVRDKGKTKIKFIYPIKQLLQDYSGYFQVHTIFESFQQKDKENIHELLSALQGMLRTTERDFKKIKAYSIYKSNPFFFKDKGIIDIPEVVIEHQEDFEVYIHKRDNLKMIALDHRQLFQCESSLSLLLDQLLQFQMQFSDLKIDFSKIKVNNEKKDKEAEKKLFDKFENVSQDIGKIVNQLRLSIEDLIKIGVLIGNDSQTTLNKIVQCNNQIKEKLDRQNTTTQPLNEQLNQQESKQGSEGQQSNEGTIQIQQKKEEKSNYEEMMIQKDMEVMSQFADKFRSIQNIIEVIYKCLANNEQEEAMKLFGKFGTYAYKLKTIFDIKSNLLILKDGEIHYLKNQIMLYKTDIKNMQDFIEEMQKMISSFFEPIKMQMQDIIYNFNGIFDSGKINDPKTKKAFIIQFKKNMQLVLEAVKKILENRCPDQQFNLRTITQEFLNRIKLVLTRNDKLKRTIDK